jgi:hypothetical protein
MTLAREGRAEIAGAQGEAVSIRPAQRAREPGCNGGTDPERLGTRVRAVDTRPTDLDGEL